jgi:membrane protease YdiL (CAAX protease family)
VASGHENTVLGKGPGRLGAIVDILVYLGAALGFWGLEELLRYVDKFPYPGLFDGAMSLVLSFFVVVGIMKLRGQSWSHFGLKKPRHWWTIPLWGFIVLLVVVALQTTIVPLLSKLLNLPAPDLSRYDVIKGNLSVFLLAAIGVMITGGFIEEFIYRGFMVDRIGRVLGGGKWGVRLAALLCGIPFGLVHFQWGIGGMFVTVIMGSVLGLMYLATRRNLWPLIAAHATLDFIMLLQVYLGLLSDS